MPHLLNTRDVLVSDAIDGELRAAGGRLARLDGFPDIRVVLRADPDRSRVAVISGGGAGHEPAHAGFVGRGLLAAAVSGDVFASPATAAVLAAIRAVAGPPGVLLVVKNYTGDRLNFGLAAEWARAEGIPVETVVVGDDVSLPHLAQPRGIAGTLLVHKIAGHAAESGAELPAVAAAAREAAAAIRSIGMALSTCTVPGHPDPADGEGRIASGEFELGLGIHGEPGAERARLGTAREVVSVMLDRLGAASLPGPLALLVNNLGALPPVELAVVTGAALSVLGSRVELLLGPAPLMTSLDMKGFSLSLLPLDDRRRAALLAPTDARAWPEPTRPAAAPPLLPLPRAPSASDTAGSAPAPGASAPAADPAAHAILSAALDALCAAENELNRLDGRVGDGDTGSTVARACRALRADLDALLRPDAGDPSGTTPDGVWGASLLRIADSVSRSMGGSSGVIAAIFLSAAGAALRDGASWPVALRAGLDRVRFHGGAREGDRTALDALEPAIRVLENGGSPSESAAAAAAGAANTAAITRTVSGRSAYLGEAELQGHADPGAVAVATLFSALASRPGDRPNDRSD